MVVGIEIKKVFFFCSMVVVCKHLFEAFGIFVTCMSGKMLLRHVRQISGARNTLLMIEKQRTYENNKMVWL